MDNNAHKLFCGPDSRFYSDKITLAILLASKYKSTPAQLF